MTTHSLNHLTADEQRLSDLDEDHCYFAMYDLNAAKFHNAKGDGKAARRHINEGLATCDRFPESNASLRKCIADFLNEINHL
jgi:hypothetical protein